MTRTLLKQLLPVILTAFWSAGLLFGQDLQKTKETSSDTTEYLFENVKIMLIEDDSTASMRESEQAVAIWKDDGDTAVLILENKKIFFVQRATDEAQVSEKKRSDSKVQIDRKKLTSNTNKEGSDREREEEKDKTYAHWAGLEFGVKVLTDGNFDNEFHEHPFWKNDPSISQVWNLNALDYKFNILKPYVGITTGLGIRWTSIAFSENYSLTSQSDTIFGTIDTSNIYRKNKLKASFLTAPVLLEFNTKRVGRLNEPFYLAVGFIGGVRLTSKLKQHGKDEHKNDFKRKERGTYALNPFSLDATVRFGYGNFGVYAYYGLLPMFDTNKTVPVHSFNFGLSMTIH